MVFGHFLTLLHSEWPKLHKVLAILSAIRLKKSKEGVFTSIREEMFIGNSMESIFRDKQGKMMMFRLCRIYRHTWKKLTCCKNNLQVGLSFGYSIWDRGNLEELYLSCLCAIQRD